MKKCVLGLAAILFIVLSACRPANSNFLTVDVEDFATIIADSSVQCVDVRTDSEYSEGHIAGSMNIDVKNADFAQLAQDRLSKSQKVAVYCRSGNRSKKAAAVLQDMGFEVIELGVGFNGWKQAGMPFEQ